MSEIAPYLRDVYFFKELTDEDINYISRFGRVEVFGGRAIVFREGDRADKFYVVKSGRVEIWKSFDTPDAIMLSSQGSGHIFGEMALVDDLNRSATIITTEPSEFITFTHIDFEHIMQERAKVTHSILRSLSSMVRASNDLVLQNLRDQNAQLRKAFQDLKQTQDELLRAERFSNMGKFASFILHDLRNPIAVIRGYAEMISLDAPDSSGLSEYARKIMFEADHVTRFANEILDYSRGEIRLNYGMVTLDSLFAKARSYLTESFAKKRISLSFSNACSRPVLIDEERILRALINIADNARKASEAGGQVEISAVENGREFSIVIKDQGEGMSQEVLSRVFEPFYSSSKKGGTGLGMLIVKNVIEAHQGHIQLASELGKGTTITLTLPTQP